MRLVIDATDLNRIPDQALITLIARAHVYLDRLTQHPGTSVGDVAAEFGVHRVDVGRILSLAFLAPRIVDQILSGHQPEGLSTRTLARANLPYLWAEQPSAIH